MDFTWIFFHISIFIKCDPLFLFSCWYPVSLLNVHEKIRSKPSTWMVAAFYPVLGQESLWDERGGNSPLVGLGGQTIRRVQGCDLRLRKFKRAWLRKRRKGCKRRTGGRPRSNGIWAEPLPPPLPIGPGRQRWSFNPSLIASCQTTWATWGAFEASSRCHIGTRKASTAVHQAPTLAAPRGWCRVQQLLLKNSQCCVLQVLCISCLPLHARGDEAWGAGLGGAGASNSWEQAQIPWNDM